MTTADMTPPKDQARGLVARAKRALDRKPDATRCDLTRETVEGLIHAYEQLEAENAELRAKLDEVEVQAACQMMIVGFMLDCNAIGIPGAAENLVRKIKDRAALTEQANIRSPVQSEMAKMVDPRKDGK